MKKSEFVIGIDMDDTIENLLPAWLQYLNNKHQMKTDYTDIKEWNMTASFPTLTREEIYEPLDIDDFWKTVQPKPDAQKYVKQLMDEGFPVYICTSSHYKTLKSKLNNVLFKYFPYITWDQIIITSNKQLINCSVLVDDGLHNLSGGSYKKILMDAPYNRKNVEKDVYRVNNWNEVYNKIIELFEEENKDEKQSKN